MGSEIAHVQAKGLVILVKHAWTQNILQNLETQYFTLGQKHQCLMSIKYWGGRNKSSQETATPMVHDKLHAINSMWQVHTNSADIRQPDDIRHKG